MPSTAVVRALLTEAFDAQSFENFCFDNFRAVYNDFAGQIPSARIQLLIAYVVRYGQLLALLDKVRIANPYVYGKHEPDLWNITVPPVDRVGLDPPPERHLLIGRKGELARLDAALRQSRTVLLHGLGGIGKTALAEEAARRFLAAGQAKDGAVWVPELGDVSLSALCDVVAHRLDNKQIPNLAPTEKPASLRSLLSHHHVLVVLDSLENTQSAREFLGKCLPEQMPLLVTSRRHLLGFHTDVEVLRLGRETAVALFQDRAGLGGDDTVAPQICVLLGDHPLALVIAAGRVRAEGMPLASLQGRLQDETRRLATLTLGKGKDVNVWASLRVSIEPLTAEQQRVFGYVAGGFGETLGLELLAEACGLPRDACEDLVGELVTRSLVERGSDRLGVHPLVRDFGREMLGNELVAVLNRLLEVAPGYAKRYGHGRVEDLDKLEVELGTLQGAVDYGVKREAWAQVLGIAGQLADGFLQLRGYWNDQVRVGRLGVVAAEKLGDERNAAVLQHNIAVTVANQGDYTEARRLYERCLAIFRRLGDVGNTAATLHQLGSLAKRLGEYSRANGLYKESLDIHQKSANQIGIAHILGELGILAKDQGDYDDAKRRHEDSLKIFRKLKDERGIAFNLEELGTIARVKGDDCQGKLLYEESLAVKRKLRDWEGIAVSLNNLGAISQDHGNYGNAKQLYQESLGIVRKLNDPEGIAFSLCNLATLARFDRDFPEAKRLLSEGLAIYRELGNQGGIAMILDKLGLLFHVQKDFEEATRCYRESLTINRELPNPKGVATTLHNMGVLFKSKGDCAEARRLLTESLKIFERLSLPEAETVRRILAELPP